MRKIPRLKNPYSKVYKPRGAARKLFLDPNLDPDSRETFELAQKGLTYVAWPEILLEGPVGTGKTFALLQLIKELCGRYPGLRVLFTRNTRASLNETVLEQWEDEVLGEHHEAVQNGPLRENRKYYRWRNKSQVNVIGMNNPDRVMSGRYDIIIYFEVVDEQNEGTWDQLLTRLRNQRIPYPRGHADKRGYLLPSAYKFKLKRPIPKSINTIWQLRQHGWFEPGGPLPGAVWPDGKPVFLHMQIGDCNPGHPAHWMNKRADRIRDNGKPQMLRLLSRHEDNPTVTEEYLTFLRGLQGEKRARLYEGRWVAAEGSIFKAYRDTVHHVPYDANAEYDYYVGGIDFGYEDAGVYQVWGVNSEGMTRVMEVYQTHRQYEWWADVVADTAERFPTMEKILADPSRPDGIERINMKLAVKGLDFRVEKANNAILEGIDAIIYGLNPGNGAPPLLRFAQGDAVFPLGTDSSLSDRGKCVCTEEEFAAYVWDTWSPGKPYKERPKPGQDDHGIDVARYVAIDTLHPGKIPQDMQGGEARPHWTEAYCKGKLRDLDRDRRRGRRRA